MNFVASIVRDKAPLRILDIGCGTGTNLTLPLAQAFPDIGIVGADVDIQSIALARNQAHPKNLSFTTIDELGDENSFDLVIASEVLEHVEEPGAFLNRLRELAKPDGQLIVTVPNGYGPFEWCSMIEALLHISGLQSVLRRLKRSLWNTRPVGESDAVPTLAVSPHINFFSHGKLLRLFDLAGFSVTQFQPTTFLCGYGIDSLIKGRSVIAWNATVADRLPVWCVSDWMFHLQPVDNQSMANWRPNHWGRFRRWLNRRRWKLA